MTRLQLGAMLASLCLLAGCSGPADRLPLSANPTAPEPLPVIEKLRPRALPHTLRYPEDPPEYSYAPMPEETILLQSQGNQADAFTLVEAVEAGGVRYIKYEFRYWGVDSATSYTGAELLSMEALGLISDTTSVFDDRPAYAYTGILDNIQTSVAMNDALSSSPPPPPPSPPPAPPGGNCTCTRKKTWGQIKIIYQ